MSLPFTEIAGVYETKCTAHFVSVFLNPLTVDEAGYMAIQGRVVETYYSNTTGKMEIKFSVADYQLSGAILFSKGPSGTSFSGKLKDNDTSQEYPFSGVSIASKCPPTFENTIDVTTELLRLKQKGSEGASIFLQNLKRCDVYSDPTNQVRVYPTSDLVGVWWDIWQQPATNQADGATANNRPKIVLRGPVGFMAPIATTMSLSTLNLENLIGAMSFRFAWISRAGSCVFGRTQVSPMTTTGSLSAQTTHWFAQKS